MGAGTGLEGRAPIRMLDQKGAGVAPRVAQRGYPRRALMIQARESKNTPSGV
jgi:hypothetical protein